MDTLWRCLVSYDVRTNDELFTWILRQIKSKDQHAFDAETLKHLYCHLMPTLTPETMTLISLTLLQQLCNMCRSREFLKSCGDKIAIDHLWKVALRAVNTGKYVDSYFAIFTSILKFEEIRYYRVLVCSGFSPFPVNNLVLHISNANFAASLYVMYGNIDWIVFAEIFLEIFLPVQIILAYIFLRS